MKVQEILEMLHPLERRVIPFLRGGVELNDIAEKSGMKKIEAMRALQWLENKDILKIKSVSKEIISLDENGRAYLDKGLPERRFLEHLDGEMSLTEIKERAKLNDDEVRIALGVLKSKYAISILGNRVEATGKKRELLKDGFPEETFLKRLPLNVSDLDQRGKTAYSKLSKRKRIIKREEVKLKYVDLTKLGKEVISKFKKTKIGDLVERLTPKMLKDGSWKGKDFRRYDIKINVPKIYGGRRHFVNQAVEYARRIWLDLGFKEMTGNMLQTSFWNFDALFQPQDHPARDLMDTMFIKNPKYGRLLNKKVVERVKKTHENGWTTRSIGWRYKWDEREARKNCMRTHTTVLSAKTIALLKKSDLPAKFFSFGKNFRNETLDWSHLFELIQTDGIVVDPDANFRHLLGYLREFFRKMGFEKIRFRPAYFPYTEMSVEPEVFHPVHKKWVELGGSGIFRPEVVKPLLGEDIPVLAWGLGFDRTIMDYYGLNDIRKLYKNDLKQLRETKIWL
ncbi:MAG: phenylalanine--tRNA ligase subunit alpha [Candidatus Aenigmarchaeota archaeon]|nr:phenylalanine--tRNA ligase subunit alpha [Candidatus Aenigmarchaeota archaeon]NIP39918.1 phenylalanine--tRNA ligase subunit alpha [Candidatus Aenigmarchaeota archaeon]NIQ17637.1 phenylalanine--tRNA ligase subunit alpha [Candidatus Aenigmarchaeota archaeon]NIS72825.1 phenylalanine--tRNA ligase subunit alpha [Candidatus Aenigmarchaeota archaeon]